MARLYDNASVRKLSGNTFVEVTAMISTSAQSGYTVPFMLVHAGKYRTLQQKTN